MIQLRLPRWKAVLQWQRLVFRRGDIIKEYQGYHIDLARDLYLYMYLNSVQEDETIHMTVERDGKDVELSFKPDVQVRYLLGFNRKNTDSLEVES